MGDVLTFQLEQLNASRNVMFHSGHPFPELEQNKVEKDQPPYSPGERFRLDVVAR